jgi:hypothetical protein
VRGKQGQHAHRYGTVHKKLRKRLEAQMRAGKVFYCWRPECRKPINPSYWDLGHVEPEFQSVYGLRHPECPSCNRATLPRMLTQARGEQNGGARPPAPKPVHDCRKEFDPKRCVECRRSDPTPTNDATRWSLHWATDPEHPYNPRCPRCRSGVRRATSLWDWRLRPPDARSDLTSGDERTITAVVNWY